MKDIWKEIQENQEMLMKLYEENIEELRNK